MYGKKGCGCGCGGAHGHMPMPIQGYNKVNMCPPVVHQPIQFVKQNTFTHIVPHVHPVHTTEINNHVFQHQHHFPHTHQSTAQVTNQDCQYGQQMWPKHHKPGC